MSLLGLSELCPQYVHLRCRGHQLLCRRPSQLGGTGGLLVIRGEGLQAFGVFSLHPLDLLAVVLRSRSEAVPQVVGGVGEEINLLPRQPQIPAAILQLRLHGVHLLLPTMGAFRGRVQDRLERGGLLAVAVQLLFQPLTVVSSWVTSCCS